MFVQVSHDVCSCKLVTTYVCARQPRQLLLSMFVHVSHDNSCWVCLCMLATKWVRAFGCNGIRFYCHRIDFDWSIVSYNIEKVEIRSSASFLVVKLRTISAIYTRAFPQSCGRDKIPPSCLGYDNTRGARVIIRYYERCESNSSKLREIRMIPWSNKRRREGYSLTWESRQ